MCPSTRTHFGEVVKVIGRARDQLLSGLRDRLAAILRFGSRDGRDVLRDEVAELAQQRGPLGCGSSGPGRESRFCGGDGCGNLLLTALPRLAPEPADPPD